MNRKCWFCSFDGDDNSLEHTVFHTVWQMRESAKVEYPASALQDAIAQWASNLEAGLNRKPEECPACGKSECVVFNQAITDLKVGDVVRVEGVYVREPER